jgi:hypothetical protein
MHAKPRTIFKPNIIMPSVEVVLELFKNKVSILFAVVSPTELNVNRKSVLTIWLEPGKYWRMLTVHSAIDLDSKYLLENSFSI